jgi:hypothetical protein
MGAFACILAKYATLIFIGLKRKILDRGLHGFVTGIPSKTGNPRKVVLGPFHNKNQVTHLSRRTSRPHLVLEFQEPPYWGLQYYWESR